ncbi:MAG: hypothetical protein ACR2IH_09410 [Pyrinomonadaceae bacterium]
MPKPLILSLDGHEFPVQLSKIDRTKLYGEIEIEAFDEKGNAASLKVLAADGKTLLDKGGTALATLNEEGESISRTELVPVDEDGEAIVPVPSSFGQVNVLKRSSTDDYLSQVVKSIYVLESSDDPDGLEFLQSHLSADHIYSFPFSYRGGVEYDSAFVLGDDANAFMVIGKQAALEYVRLNQTAVLDTPEEAEISADELDFDLL